MKNDLTVAGYRIIKRATSRIYDVVIGFNPDYTYYKYVCWYCSGEDNCHDGYYTTNYEDALEEFSRRVN